MSDDDLRRRIEELERKVARNQSYILEDVMPLLEAFMKAVNAEQAELRERVSAAESRIDESLKIARNATEAGDKWVKTVFEAVQTSQIALGTAQEAVARFAELRTELTRVIGKEASAAALLEGYDTAKLTRPKLTLKQYLAELGAHQRYNAVRNERTRQKKRRDASTE